VAWVRKRTIPAIAVTREKLDGFEVFTAVTTKNAVFWGVEAV
jgi:hypothetical protein